MFETFLLQRRRCFNIVVTTECLYMLKTVLLEHKLSIPGNLNVKGLSLSPKSKFASNFSLYCLHCKYQGIDIAQSIMMMMMRMSTIITMISSSIGSICIITSGHLVIFACASKPTAPIFAVLSDIRPGIFA